MTYEIAPVEASPDAPPTSPAAIETVLSNTAAGGPEHVVELRRPGLFKLLRRDKFAMAGLVLLVIVALVAIFADFIAPHDPEELFVGEGFEGRSGDHLLGTDQVGRDNFSRIVLGTRVAVRVVLQTISVTLLLAVPLGLIAGFVGRKVDVIIMRAMDAVHSIPTVVLALALATTFDQSFNWALFGIALGFTPTMTRLIRGEVLALREEAFIEASMCIGTRLDRILRRRVLHNVASPIIVQTSVFAGGAILVEASLSVLGVGIGAGEAAWGSMLREAFDNIQRAPSNVIYPGAAIALTVLAANLLGDGLRDALHVDAGRRYGAKTRMGLTEARPADTRPADSRPADTTISSAPVTVAAEEAAAEATPVLAAEHLTVSVGTDAGTRVLVDDVTFQLRRGEVLGLVGESGSGKTVTSLGIMRLLPSPPFSITGGRVLLDGEDLLRKSMREMRDVRGKDIAMIFQDPMAALNPSISVGAQLAEAVLLHEKVDRAAARRRAVDLLERVGIPDPTGRMRNYPHEFSGGMRQRAMIAMALACSPKVLIADEPTTALDVTIQAQVLELLTDLRRDFGLSVIFVTHDLGVVADLCDRVMVMYAGQVVEQASVQDLFARPAHPYSKALLKAMPRLAAPDATLYSIPGSVPVGAMPSGCRFHPRCEFAIDACRSGEVPLFDVGASRARCLRATELIGPESST
jgi:peptide/nickel transport system permease protein